MKKLIKTIILLVIGIIAIPALYALGMTLFGTVIGFIANPRVMIVIIAVLAVICFPGMVIVWLVKR